jgi:hypothetical protein
VGKDTSSACSAAACSHEPDSLIDDRCDRHQINRVNGGEDSYGHYQTGSRQPLQGFLSVT